MEQKVKCNNCEWKGEEQQLQDELCPKCGMNSEGKIMDINETKNITIIIEGGALQEVEGLPDGWTFTLIDHDN